jgi:predicted transcriptional regulator of viral defense system
MNSTHVQQLLQYAHRHPVVRTRDLETIGVPRGVLGQLVTDGRLCRLSRGLYALTDAEPSRFQSYAEVAKRVPKAVICLQSALSFHEIGTQAPFEVWIALPAGTHSPKLDSPQLRIIRPGESAFSQGVETHVIAGVPVKIYSAAKTIIDCFKFRNKIGLDVALEALKDAWRRKLVTMDELWRFAEINRVKNIMRPYLETLAA